MLVTTFFTWPAKSTARGPTEIFWSTNQIQGVRIYTHISKCTIGAAAAEPAGRIWFFFSFLQMDGKAVKRAQKSWAAHFSSRNPFLFIFRLLWDDVFCIWGNNKYESRIITVLSCCKLWYLFPKIWNRAANKTGGWLDFDVVLSSSPENSPIEPDSMAALHCIFPFACLFWIDERKGWENGRGPKREQLLKYKPTPYDAGGIPTTRHQQTKQHQTYVCACVYAECVKEKRRPQTISRWLQWQYNIIFIK